MSFEEQLQEINAQKKIDKLAKKLKNKKVLIYGAGEYSTAIFNNYDLSKINIVAIVDKIFEQNNNGEVFGYKSLAPREIKNIDFGIQKSKIYL